MPCSTTARYLKGGAGCRRASSPKCATLPQWPQTRDFRPSWSRSPSATSLPSTSMCATSAPRRSPPASISRNGAFPPTITASELEAAIHGLNADPRVTGIIIQRPVPAHIPIKALQAAIHPLKDVEGMHPASIGNIVYNQLDLAPCTAAASVELLKATGLDLKGLEVVIVGHSEIVGKPIAFLLMSEGATVTVCHHMTRSVAAHARRADALFVAVGKPRLIKADMVKPGAAVIDIGINSEIAAGRLDPHRRRRSVKESPPGSRRCRRRRPGHRVDPAAQHHGGAAASARSTRRLRMPTARGDAAAIAASTQRIGAELSRQPATISPIMTVRATPSLCARAGDHRVASSVHTARSRR